MKKILLSLSALAFAATMQVKAEVTDISSIENVVYMESVTLPAGSQQTLSVRMKNTVGIQTVQFDMVLPEGVTIVTDEDDFELISLSTARTTAKKMDSFSYALISGTRYRVLINSNGGYTFDGEDGEIVQVVVNIDASLAGSTLPFVFEGIVLVDTGSNGFETERLETSITVTEPEDTRIILDENSTTAPEAATGVDILVKRTIKADEWSTLCLPFDMTEAQVTEAFGSDVELGDFTGAESQFDEEDNVVGITASFDNVTAVEANHPYIIRVSQPIEEFTLDGVDIVPDEDEAYIEFDNGKSGSRRVVYSGFYGTYHAGTVLDEYTVFLNAGKYWYSKGLTKMKAFRAYFSFLDVLTAVEEGSSSARVSMRFNGDDSTGIQHIATKEQEADGATYDLLGRRVVKPGKGLYIRGGKVIVNK